MDSETTPSPRVGETVVARRHELGMNQTDLWRNAGVDPRTVRDLERDQRWPRDTSRTKIERALSWSIGTLERLRSGQPLDQATETTPESETPPFDASLPIGQPETAAQLVLAMDEVFARLHSSILAEPVLKHLPPETQQFLEYLDYAGQLAETLAVTITGSGEALAKLKREERARLRAITWAPPSPEHLKELEEWTGEEQR